MTTTITCTKSEFATALKAKFGDGINDIRNDSAELIEIIDGLVRQANEHRGIFEGHSAYLDCDFVVSPDGPSERAQGAIFAPVPDAPTKTMADYVPGAAVKRQLVELSYVSAISLFKLVRMGVEAECSEQGVKADSEEIATWVVEQVAEIVEYR
jgi:hypothetical protein